MKTKVQKKKKTNLRKAIDNGMSVREAAKQAIASLPLAIRNHPKLRASQVGVKWMTQLIKLVLDDQAPCFEVGMCCGQGGCDFMVADDPETLDLVYYANDEFAANADCKVLNKFVKDLYREPKVYETEYAVEPRFHDKMQKVFVRYGVDWTPSERDDEGCMVGLVTGDKEAVIKFVMETWNVSRRKALGEVSEKRTGKRTH